MSASVKSWPTNSWSTNLNRTIRRLTQVFGNACPFWLGALLGAAIWAASPWLVDRVEPWDGAGPFAQHYYPAALLLAGLIGGWRFGKGRQSVAGILFGQIAFALIFLPLDPLMLLGLGFLAAYSLVAAVGALIGVMARKSFARRRDGAI